MNKGRLVCKKVLSIALSVALLSSSVLTTLYAQSETTGTYSYTSNEGSNKQATDTFVFRDSFFTGSSYNESTGLRTLSTQVALASASRYGEGEDKYERDYSDCGANIKAFLTSMGFQNVEANRWYSQEKEPDSLGVAIGSRQIVQDGKTYTLLAIIPRSAGYKQEWVGDFNVGSGDIHEGFKAGRDEALRFTKQYINSHNITGDLKVWIAGHSRGAAMSNLIGGFFVGGGAKYFGDNVSITPENVYCYTFATPKTIKDGASKNNVLSVSAARGGVYTYDSPGDAYVYSEGGTIGINDGLYNCIRNYPFDYDFITYLPLAQWGFSNYGQFCNFKGATEPNMIKELSKVNKYVYDHYIEGASPSKFHEKTLDVANLTTKDVPGGKSGQEGMVSYIRERINGFGTTYSSNAEYVSGGYQETYQSFIVMYAMLYPVISEIEGVEGMVTQPLFLSYLSYASDCLIKEGRANNVNDASAIAVAEILSVVLEKKINPENYSVDEFFADITRFIADNEDKKISKDIIKMITQQVPEEYAKIAKTAFESYCPNYDPDKTSLSDVIFAFIKACAYGADPKSKAYEVESQRDPINVRKSLYSVISLMSLTGNKTFKVINESIKGGKGTFTEFVTALLIVMRMDGTGQEKYASLDAAATGELQAALTQIETKSFEIIEKNNLYTDQYRQEVHQYFARARENVPIMRKSMMTLLFTHNGKFDTDYNIRSLATIVGNSSIIPAAHYNEIFVAWAKAAPEEVTGISVSPKAHSMAPSETLNLSVKVTPADAPKQEFTYTTSDTAVATVDSNGKVTAVADGEATITVKTADSKFSDTCVVTVRKYNPNVKPPEANIMITYTGDPHDLVEPGSTDGGKMYYGLGTEKEEPAEWTTSVPQGTEPGYYYVWYKVVGDEKYNDIKPTYVGESTHIVKYSDNVISVDPDNDAAVVGEGGKGPPATVAFDVVLEGEICRMYDPIRGEHFYTKNQNEAAYLQSIGWVHEEESDFVVVDAANEYAVAVFRMYNPNGGGMHFYTEDASEAKGLVSEGWNYEGISHYVYKKSCNTGLAQYRVYNPNSPVGEHNWTTNVNEWNMLKSLGWIDEGIRWKIEEW